MSGTWSHTTATAIPATTLAPIRRQEDVIVFQFAIPAIFQFVIPAIF
jgi:hypothetical protein